MSDRFVDAYVIATGEKQKIPRHWLDHPTLSKPFRLTPKQRKRNDTPTTAAHDEVPATPDPDVTSPETPDLDTTTPTETPAAGAEE